VQPIGHTLPAFAVFSIELSDSGARGYRGLDGFGLSDWHGFASGLKAFLCETGLVMLHLAASANA
jgi:hypothetical protein